MKADRPKARLMQGFRDVFSADILARQRMIDTIRRVYESYGFLPLETPALEFVDALGKFLPESATPQGGIFAFRNPDIDKGESPNLWLALRYDLTAPLARVVAQYRELQKPFRRYQVGPVWRHEKPGPGRFREFYQFDFDSVGTSSMAADAEACSIICDALEALGFSAGGYVIKVNNRKVLQGILEACKLTDVEISEESRALTVLRAIDKYDRLGIEGVCLLLGEGRKDESGDFTPGAKLEPAQIDRVKDYLSARAPLRTDVCGRLAELVGDSKIGQEGVAELRQIDEYLTATGYGPERVEFDPVVVRGMSYYTGPVFEGVLTAKVVDEDGQPRAFGSVFGGGRYDDLVQRFTGQKVPATGASIGVDRLLEAIKALQFAKTPGATAQVLVTVMDKARMADYMKIAQELRRAGINAEVFLGKGRIGEQLKYADKIGIPVALIAGEDEFQKGEYQLKDLLLGMELSKEVKDHETWRQDRPAQQTVAKETLVAKVREMLG